MQDNTVEFTSNTKSKSQLGVSFIACDAPHPF
jgi:hypothetical protein